MKINILLPTNEISSTINKQSPSYVFIKVFIFNCIKVLIHLICWSMEMHE